MPRKEKKPKLREIIQFMSRRVRNETQIFLKFKTCIFLVSSTHCLFIISFLHGGSGLRNSFLMYYYAYGNYRMKTLISPTWPQSSLGFVIGQVALEKESETDPYMKECYWGVLLGTTPWRGKGSRTGQREKLSHIRSNRIPVPRGALALP